MPVSGVTLVRVRDITLAIVVILVLYPRGSRAATNLEQASASTVVVGNRETITNDMVAVAAVIQTGAERVAQAVSKIEDAVGRFGETATAPREEYADFDLASADLRGQMERFLEHADEVDALLSRFGR